MNVDWSLNSAQRLTVMWRGIGYLGQASSLQPLAYAGEGRLDMAYERDAFCAECGKQIDTVSTPSKENTGFVEALILGESRRIHQCEDHCRGLSSDAEAWTFGPWREVQD